jgi:tRNA A-37 threonylcarbamoyl transferase component Bud32
MENILTSTIIIDSFELKLKTCVREVPGKRRVFSGSLDNKDVFIKIFEHPTSAQRHFARELNGIEAFLEKKILSPQILWQGKIPEVPELKIPENALAIITEELIDSQSFESSYSGDNKTNALKQLFTVVKAQHRAQLIQKDLHPGNFLFSKKYLYSLDGDAVIKKGTPLSDDEIADNYALLFAQFPVNDTNLLNEAIDGIYTTSKNFEEKVFKARSKRCQKYLKKVFRDCTEISHRKIGSRDILLKSDYDSKEMMDFLQDPEAHFPKDPKKLLKNGNSATVAALTINGLDLVIKRNNYNKNLKTFIRRFRESRGSISWRNSFRLLNYGFQTPTPVAYMEVKRGPAVTNAYFITEKSHGIDALDYFNENLDESLADNFIEVFKGWERCRITHGDCKATNFLIENGQVVIIDLDAMKEHKNPDSFKKGFKKDLKRWMANWQEKPLLTKLFQDKFKAVNLSHYL